MASTPHLSTAGRIEFGRFEDRPSNADPTEGAGWPARWLRRTRLKEWVGFLVVHPEWSTSFIMQDAKYLASSDFFAYHRPTDRLHARQAVAPPGALRLPSDLPDATCRFVRDGYSLEFAFDRADGAHRVLIDIAASEHSDAIRGELTLDTTASSAPLSVSAKLPRGSLYTWKQVFAVGGTLSVGDEAIVFDPDRDLAIIDEHRSLLPYRTDWTWGTFAFRDAGRIVGANVATRPQLPDQEEESSLWIDGDCEPLADVSFTAKGDDPLGPWTIASDDGRLEVTFEPSRRNTVRHQLGVFAVDYFMMYGTYRGVVRGTHRTCDVDGVSGVCEKMRARL